MNIETIKEAQKLHHQSQMELIDLNQRGSALIVATELLSRAMRVANQLQNQNRILIDAIQSADQDGRTVSSPAPSTTGENSGSPGSADSAGDSEIRSSEMERDIGSMPGIESK